jgi:nitroreductase
MELARVMGNRRSVRWLRPDVPVEQHKIQKMLEAARRCSFWGNVQALRAVVVERGTAGPEVLAALEGMVGAYQVRMAPVVIVWILDDAAIDEQGDRLHEIVAARAMGIDEDDTRDHLENTLLPFFEKNSEHLKKPGPTEIDCGQGIAQATLMAFDLGLGTCLVGGAYLKKLGRALGIPPTARVLLMQTVGYPAEDYLAGGQRPRLPFEQLYHLNQYGTPFKRDPEVVRELEEAGLIQEVGPRDRAARDAELKALGEQFDYPPY